MKTSIFKKMAIAFAAFAAFAGSASAYYHSGDIFGTTGFGTKNSPIQVNTFNELKAALEHPEIDYVELGDVSGEDGLIRLGEEGESGSVESAIVITTTKFLKLVGKAEFTRDPNYKEATIFIKVKDAGDSWGKLSVDGEGSLTYASISSENMFFTGGDYSTLVINSGNLTCTYNKSTASHCTTINNGRGSLYIYGGYIKEESNDGLTSFDGCQSCDKAVFVGSYGHLKMFGGTLERYGLKRSTEGASFAVSDENTGSFVMGGTFKGEQNSKSAFVRGLYQGDLSMTLKALIPGKAFNVNNEEVSLETRSIDETITIEPPKMNVSSTNGGDYVISNYYHDGRVELTATAEYGFVFAGWVNGGNPSDTLSKKQKFYYNLTDMPNVKVAFAAPITFINSDGGTVLQESVVALGETPVPPTVSVKDDNEYYHYFAKWDPEIVAATQAATYKLVIDSSLKRLDITLNLIGGLKVSTNTPSPCIEATPLKLKSNEDDLSINQIPNFKLTNGTTYTINLGVAVENAEACQEDDYVKAIKVPGSDVKIFVNGVNTKKLLNEANNYKNTAEFSGAATYGIWTPQELKDFAAAVKGGSSDANAILFSNIILNNGQEVLNDDGTLYNNGESLESWEPIGTVENVFSGTFDGNGHFIRGMYVNGENDYVGLFGATFKATVKNVRIADSYFRGKKFVGSVVGFSMLGNVFNIYNGGTVVGEESVGGIVGEIVKDGNDHDWLNTGKVIGSASYIGGMVGWLQNSKISNTYNAGAVSGSGLMGCVIGFITGDKISNNNYYDSNVCNHVTTQLSAANRPVGLTSAQLAELDVVTAFSSDAGAWTAGSKVTGDGFVTYKFPYLTAFGAKSQPEYSPAIEFAAGNASATVYGATTGSVNISSEITVNGPITFNRAFPDLAASDAYSTIMLPFEPANKPTGATFYTLGSISSVNGNWKISATEVTGALDANTPYLVKVASGTKSITFNGGTFKKTEGEHSVTNGNWKFVGSYEYKAWEEGDEGLGSTYGFAGSAGNNPAIVGKFAKVGAGAYIYPMRAYLEYTAPAVLGRPAANGETRTVASLPSEIDVVITEKDEATGEETTKVVGSLNTRTGEIKFANDRWFDLQGRYLGNKKPTQKGAYYNNGKKVIVK